MMIYSVHENHKDDGRGHIEAEVVAQNEQEAIRMVIEMVADEFGDDLTEDQLFISETSGIPANPEILHWDVVGGHD